MMNIVTCGVSILAGCGVVFTAEVPGQRHATPVKCRFRSDVTGHGCKGQRLRTRGGGWGHLFLASELLLRAGALAEGLRSAERAGCVYVGGNTAAFSVAMFGCTWAGVASCPVINYRLAVGQLVELVGARERAMGLAEGPASEVLAGAGMAVRSPDSVLDLPSSGRTLRPWMDDPDAVAVLLYTSGTTARPKTVVLRQRHLAAYVVGSVEFYAAGVEKVALVSVPAYHMAAVANLHSNLYDGRKIVCLQSCDAAEWLRLAERYRVTHNMVVPTMLARSTAETQGPGRAPPPQLRELSYGGAKTPRGVLKAALAAFPNGDFVNAYGMTEASSTVSVLGPEDYRRARTGDTVSLRRLESVGQVLFTVELQIRDSDGRIHPSGQTVSIFVKGEQVAGGVLGRRCGATPRGGLPLVTRVTWTVMGTYLCSDTMRTL